MGKTTTVAINKTIEFVQNQMKSFGTSHAWDHIERVWKNAKSIAAEEKVDLETVELSALLHDVTDRKYFKGSYEEGEALISSFLESIAIPPDKIMNILKIIDQMSFSKDGVVTSEEQKVVQDADRLDAIGAIGIARCIAYATEVGHPIHIPGVLGEYDTIEAYKKHGSASAISHFYDKLLKIKDKMLTKSGKKIAEKRHEYMLAFLDQFLEEWQGIR